RTGTWILGAEGGGRLGEQGARLLAWEALDAHHQEPRSLLEAHLEDAGCPEVLVEIEAASLLGEGLESPPPVRRAHERAFVPKAHARQIAPRLHAHLASAERRTLLHPTVLALQVVEGAHREKRAQREHDGLWAAPAVAEDRCVLPSNEGEGDLEL